MKYRTLDKMISRKEIFQTSKMYFEINDVDTFSTKFVNIDALDYTKLEKAYTKNIVISIKYLNSTTKESEEVGKIHATCFDIHEAILDDVDIKDLLDAEGENTFEIYSVIINNFNKNYYKYFGYVDERNIANITKIELNERFKETHTINNILKNIHKIIYHLLGLKISTIFTSKYIGDLEDANLMNIFTELGFLEVDCEPNFMAKNINLNINGNAITTDTTISKEIIISNFKNILLNQNEINKILNGNTHE